MDQKFLIFVSIFLIAIINPFSGEALSDSTNYKQEDVSITFTTVPCGDCDIIGTSAYSVGFSEANFTVNNQAIEFHQKLTLWCNFEHSNFSISGYIDDSTLIITETYDSTLLTDCLCITYISGLITGINSNISSLLLIIDVNTLSKTPYFTTTISYPVLDFTTGKSETTPFEISFTTIFILLLILQRKKLSRTI